MKPVKLRFRGLHSYRGWQEVDFTHPQAGPVEIPLATGADIKVKIIPPEKWRRSGVFHAIFKEGQGRDSRRFRAGDFEHQPPWGAFFALPAGKYVLVIPGSCEQRTFDKNMLKHAVFPDEEFESVEIPFIIDDNSPAEIDLGEIRLEAIPGKM